MIPQSTINACVKAYYGSMEETDYGKIQAVLLAYESMKATQPAAAAPDGWLPIDSAPRDISDVTKCGEVVLLGGDGWVSQGFYHDGSKCYGHRGEAGFFDSEDWGEDRLLIASNVHPTHWMPLPAAPANGGG